MLRDALKCAFLASIGLSIVFASQIACPGVIGAWLFDEGSGGIAQAK
jgi:hypothetical protein